MSVDREMFCCRLRSIMIFLQISLRVLAIVRAGMSHLKTWHMCLRVILSRATYAKSLENYCKTNNFTVRFHLRNVTVDNHGPRVIY